MASLIHTPVASFFEVPDLALILKGKREQHQNALNEQKIHVEMNEDFVHGFATALSFTELRMYIISPEALPERIAEWQVCVQEILDNLDDLMP